MASLQTYTIQHFKDEMESRFFPRKLIISRNETAFTKTVLQAIRTLNDNTFQHRVYEFPISSQIIDTSVMDISGIYVKKIMALYPRDEFYSFFNDYRVILGRVIYPFNILRNQDNFIEFLLSNELYKQLKKRYSNRNIDYFLDGNKILLGNSWNSTSGATVFFLPGFDYQTGTEWELYDQEEIFVSDYLEALISFKEGRAQSEMDIMSELSTNNAKLQSWGEKRMTEIVDNFKKRGFARIGWRF